MINELAQKIHQNNKAKGFYDGEKNIGEMLALVHSEVSEALEADRMGVNFPKSNSSYPIQPLGQLINDDLFKSEFEANVKDTFNDELADVIIRVLDLAAFRNINIEAHIEAKMRYNALRPHKHGKKY